MVADLIDREAAASDDAGAPGMIHGSSEETVRNVGHAALNDRIVDT